MHLRSLIDSVVTKALESESVIHVKTVDHVADSKYPNMPKYSIRTPVKLCTKASNLNGTKERNFIIDDPFRPYTKDAFVKQVNNTHNLILNKYMINRDHLLLCTIPFKTQLEHLFEDDFRAIVTILEELDNGENLVFYNCGIDSGASQLHKHVQILPTTNEVREQFFTCYLDLYNQYSSKHFTRIPELHFKHAYRSLTNLFQKDYDTIVQQLLSTYKQMLCELNLYACKPSSRVETKCVHCKGDGYDETHTVTIRDGECPSYNLIFTRKWMLIVPRCRESVDSISCNALAFVGSFFAKDEETLAHMLEIGPDEILEKLTIKV